MKQFIAKTSTIVCIAILLGYWLAVLSGHVIKPNSDIVPIVPGTPIILNVPHLPGTPIILNVPHLPGTPIIQYGITLTPAHGITLTPATCDNFFCLYPSTTATLSHNIWIHPF